MEILEFKIEDFIGVFDMDIHQIEIDKFIDYFNRCETLNVNTPRFQYSTENDTPNGKYSAHIQDKLNSIGPDKASFPDKTNIGPTSYRFMIETSGQLGDIWNNIISNCYEKYSEKYFNLRTFETQAYNANIQRTLPGQGYHVWHCENEHMYRTSNSRVLAVMMYLNDVEEGGETEFLFQHKRFKPKKGRVLLWPSGFTHTHRGNSPLAGEKYIITGWLERNLQDNSIIG